MGGNVEDLCQTVGDINDADALFAQIAHHAEQAFYFVEGERGGGFVQNQQTGMTQNAPQNLYQLLLGDGKAAGLAAKIQIPADARHGIHQLFMQLRLAFIKADDDIFFHRHIGEEQRLLRHHIDPLRQSVGGAVQRHGRAVDGQLALIVAVDPHDDLHQGGFARAVAADKRQHLTGHHVQINALENGVQSKRFINAAHSQQGGGFPCAFSGFHSTLPRFLCDDAQMSQENIFCCLFYHKVF